MEANACLHYHRGESLRNRYFISCVGCNMDIVFYIIRSFLIDSGHALVYCSLDSLQVLRTLSIEVVIQMPRKGPG